MAGSREHPRDPLRWHLALASGFFVLCLVRLTIPSKLYFDEVHYIPAARALLALARPENVEHPMLGKEILALGIALFGDRPLGWRIMPAIFGTLALFAAMRTLWFTSLSRYASIACGLLLITGFPLFVHSRIAMLDIFMSSFVLLAYWALAATLRQNETARWRLPVAGVALGLAMAAKWNAVPYAILPGLAFLAVRLQWAGGSRGLLISRGLPIRGVSLPEAALWLGLTPLATYTLTFAPAFVYAQNPVSPFGLVALHGHMLELQGGVVDPHPYMSRWYEWVIDWRAVWYLYEEVDGAMRGVLLVGNPLPMLAGLAAIGWCAWAGVAKRQWDTLAVAVLYAVGVLFWALADKPVQFYYHYLLPSCFLLAGLALALDALRRRGHFWLPFLTLAGSAALFAWFFPILTAAPLEDPTAFERWTWLDSWR